MKRALIDVTKPETLRGLCDGADAVITTVGLTGSSATITNYDIDYQGNVNLLREAQRARGEAFYIYLCHQGRQRPEGAHAARKGHV